MKPIVGRLALAFIAMLVIIQFIQPKQTNPPVDPNHEIGANLSVDPATAAVFGRSCNDCEIDRCRRSRALRLDTGHHATSTL